VVYVDANEDALTSAIATKGPISVAINVPTSFYYYNQGVFDDFANCDPTNLQHAVLAVGYGTFNGVKFYWVKNSWGSDWGVSGYIRMIRNGNSICGIASSGSYPILGKLLGKDF
jgi:cathepsin L